MNENSSWSSILMKTIIVSVIIIISLNIYGSWDSSKDESYFKKKMAIEQIENSKPTRFLTAGGNYNKSFWGTSIKIHGTVTNKATTATFKDATIRVTYYSKTKTKIRNKDYIIYKIFHPNSIEKFELKIKNFKDASTIDWKVIKASVN